MNAQTSNFGIEVCRVMSGPPAGPDAMCLGPGCFRYHYEFWLIPNGAGQGNFTFDVMEISAQLTVNGVTLATNPVPDLLSEINTESTLGCYNSSLSGNMVLSGEEASVIFSNDDNDPQTSDPPITISALQQPFHLFTLVVDAFPGETVDVIVNAMYSYQTSIGNEMQISQSCQGSPVLTAVTFPEPSACSNSSTCIEFGQVSGGGNEPAIIPVLLNGAGSNYEEVDVLVEVSFDNFMEMPEILAGDIQASDVEVFMNQSGGYSIYAHTRDVTNSTGALFRIKINGPVFISSGGKTTLDLMNGRYEPDGGNCCKPCLGASTSVEFDGFDDCTEDITIRVDGLTGTECGELFVNVSLEWPQPPAQMDFYKFTVVLDLDLVGSDISIGGLVSDDIECPTNGATYCGENTCFTIIDNNTVQYCFWVFPNPQTITYQTGFRFSIDAAEGFVNDVIFREAYIDLVGGGAGVACVPKRLIDNDFPLMNPLVAGEIKMPNGEYAPGPIDVNIAGQTCGSTLTLGDCPTYSYCDCFDNFTVTPYSNEEALNGVTTFDLVLISKHILGVQALDSPYKIIAADANWDEDVTTFDLVTLRKKILFIELSFPPAEPSWRFVDASYVFPDPFDPLFPESILVPNQPAMDVDFIAVKVGDVNWSADGGDCFTNPEPIDDRSISSIDFQAIDKPLKKGEVMSVPFQFSGGEQVVAYQAGFQFDTDKLHFLGASKGDIGALGKDNFGLTEVEQGKIRMLWFSPDGERYLPTEDDKLFYLHFEARQVLPSLEAALRLDNAVLDNFAFDAEGSRFDLALDFQTSLGEVLGAAFSVNCYPNPFSGRLAFEVETDRDQTGEILLFDAFGVLIERKQVNLLPGKNTVMLDRTADLPAGIFNWKVRTPSGRATGVAVKK